MVFASDSAELKGLPGDVLKVVTGVGPVTASVVATEAILREKPDYVFNIGSAGALGKGLGIGSVIAPGSVVNLDMDLTTYHLTLGSTICADRSTFGPIIFDRNSNVVLGTSGTFASAESEGMRNLHVSLCDMECYGIAFAAHVLKVPMRCIKLVTDIVGENVTLGDYGYNLRSLRSKLFEAFDIARAAI